MLHHILIRCDLCKNAISMIINFFHPHNFMLEYVVYTIALSTDEVQIPYGPGDIFFSEEIHSTLFRHVILSLNWEHPQSK